MGGKAKHPVLLGPFGGQVGEAGNAHAMRKSTPVLMVQHRRLRRIEERLLLLCSPGLNHDVSTAGSRLLRQELNVPNARRLPSLGNFFGVEPICGFDIVDGRRIIA